MCSGRLFHNFFTIAPWGIRFVLYGTYIIDIAAYCFPSPYLVNACIYGSRYTCNMKRPWIATAVFFF